MVMRSDLLTRGFARLVPGLAVVLAVIVAATPAEARRKFSFGSSSSSSSSAAKATKAAADANAANRFLVAATVHRATRKHLTKVYDLPVTEENALPDGRHFHIGKLRRAFFGSRYVGYLGQLDYIDLPTERLVAVLQTVGFNNVAEFEAHLAKQPPTPASDEAAGPSGDETTATAEADNGMGAWSKAFLAACSFALLGFLAYCGIAWVRNRSSAPSATSVVTTRITRTPSASPAQRLAPPPQRRAAEAEMPSPRPASRPVAARTAAPSATTPPAASSALPRRAPRKFGTTPRMA